MGKKFSPGFCNSREPNRRNLFSETVGFAIAGTVALLLDLSIFNLLVLLDINLSLANACATFSALGINFLVNHKVFIPKGSIRKNLSNTSLRFAVVATASAIVAFLGFEIAVHVFPGQSALTYSIVRVLIVGLGTVARFVLLRNWVFRA